MARGRPAARVLLSFIRSDERQSLFFAQTRSGDVQIVEDAELWEEPHPQGGEDCFHYYPTVFCERRFTDLESALFWARQWFPWISEVEDGNGGSEPVIPLSAQSATRED